MREIDGEHAFEVGTDDYDVPGYTVQLPHQCGKWIAAWGTKDEAIAHMKAFVSEAQAALEVLRSLD